MAAPPSRSSRRTEAEARFERLWLRNPEKFDPERTAMERVRQRRTKELIKEFVSLKGASVADLGCGSGLFSRCFRDGGARVDAVDIASNALKLLEKEEGRGITLKQDYIPKSTLQDEAYDLVAALELIAYIPKEGQRLAFAEMARLLKEEGHLVCSTPIDIDSTDALARFASLAETEFKVLKWRFGYHRLLIRWVGFFLAPQKFARAFKEPKKRKEGVEKRRSLSRFWFKINSTVPLAYLWLPMQYITTPVAGFFLQSEKALYFFEKISRLLWQEAGISHALFIAKLRPLIPPTDPSLQPKERKHKKQLWE